MKMIDLHCDTLLLTVEPHREQRASYLKRNDAMLDIEKLQQSQSLLQVFAMFINKEKWYEHDFEGESAWDLVQQLHRNYQHELKYNSADIAPVLAFSDIEKNDNSNKISSLLSLEGAGSIDGDMQRLHQLYDMGVRLITLTWNFENCLAYPNSPDAALMKKGLKPFGHDVIAQMNEMGMIIDVSHLSDGGFWDVVTQSKKPFTASHSNARSLNPHPRNLSDKMIAAVAETGGLIGLNYCPRFLCKKDADSTHSKVEDLVAHAKHIYKHGGIDVLALGSDFDGISGTIDISDASKTYLLLDALMQAGFSHDECEKIWNKNALRFLKEVLH